MLVQILHNRNKGKEQRTEIKKNEENERDAKGDGISSNYTQGLKNQVKPIDKRNIGHLEGEFKNIMTPSVERESKT